MTTNTLSQAVKLIKSGEKQAAAKMLIQIVKNEPANENAWLWLAYVVENEKRIHCLQKALEINPLNNKTRSALDKLQNTPITALHSTPKPAQPAQPQTSAIQPDYQSPFLDVDQEEAAPHTAYEDSPSSQGLNTDGYYIPQGLDFRDSSIEQPSQPQPVNPIPAQPQITKPYEPIELKANWSVILRNMVFIVFFAGSYSFRQASRDPQLFLFLVIFAAILGLIGGLLMYRLPGRKIILEENELIGPGTGLGRKTSIPYDDIDLKNIKRSFTSLGNYVIPSFDGLKIEVVGFDNEQYELLLALIAERQSSSYSYYR